jgi:hypothetical protein
MKTFRTTAASALAAVVLAIAACSGSPLADANAPVGAVNAAMAAAEAGGFTQLTEFMCQASKDDLAGAFGGGGELGALAAAGLDPNELFGAMKIDFQDTTVTEVSKSDSEATVHLKGKMALQLDEAKMREVIRKILETQGVEASDQMIDVAMSTMASQLSQPQDIDEDMKLINENGKWVICQA